MNPLRAALKISANKETLFRRRIIFAGRLNPIAVHHVTIIRKLIELASEIRASDPEVSVDLTVWPVGAYGDKKTHVAPDPEHHKEMLRLALAGLDVELETHDLDFPLAGSTPTFDMQKKYAFSPKTAMGEEYLSPLFAPGVLTEIWHVLGADNVDNIQGWELGSQLWKHGRFIIIPRTGPAPKMLPPKSFVLDMGGDIPGNCTDIRELITQNGAWEHLVPASVTEYIKANNLYQKERAQP